MIKYIAITKFYLDEDGIKENNYNLMVRWYKHNTTVYKESLYDAFIQKEQYKVYNKDDILILKVDTSNLDKNVFINSDIIKIYKDEDLAHLNALF